ncbi:MAG: diguanylate cyclase [Anaerolineales bacterium]|nr:diguanylate cyclase [Anaerolineales bacterium]MBX3038692.1 diguanylate cyclase [Anaerolineales bacterium]
MEIRFILKILQRGWWLILISALLALNFSLFYSYYVAVPQYEVVARFIVSPNLQSTDNRDLVNSLEALDKRSIIATYAEVLNSYQITEEAVKLLGENASDFSSYTMSATLLPDANIIRYSVRGPNPDVAALLANGIGQYAIDYVRKLYVVYNIEFLDKAIPSYDAIRPRPLQDALLALLVGMVVGVGLAIFRDQISTTLSRFGQRNVIDYESQAYTHAYFDRHMRQEIIKQPDAVITLGLIHLNGIQDIYDSLPQVYVNQILRKVNETLKYQLRGNDIVGRWSKLQFAVLLLGTDGASANRRFEHIQEVLDQPISLESDGEFDVSLDVRIGYADRQGGEAINVLINQAESALNISMESNTKTNMYKVRPFG